VAREKSYDAALRDQTLSDEQREVLTLVFRGCNVFFTGSAGTGQTLSHEITSLSLFSSSSCVGELTWLLLFVLGVHPSCQANPS
jgi:hypothetical protein